MANAINYLCVCDTPAWPKGRLHREPQCSYCEKTACKPGETFVVTQYGQEIDRVKVLDVDTGAELVPLDDDGAEIARALGMGYEVVEADQPMEVDIIVGPSMVVIQGGARFTSNIDATYEWFLTVLPGDAAQQLRDASLVIVTDPNARLCQVIKNEASVGELLVMHTAAIG